MANPQRSYRGTAVALVAAATFVDIVAYSVAVPVLPDLSRRLGASPTLIGLLFASFGVTLLTFSMPMGAVSDRIGRKPPMVGGLAALAAATLLFAFAGSLPLLFLARLIQGAADAITWVVGFALLADLYAANERGRVTGIVMAGTSFAFMIGPSLGGRLYEIGGMRLPFLAVAALTAIVAAGFVWFEPPREQAERERVPIVAVLRTPAIAACAVAVLAASSTMSMLEPVFSIHLETLGVGPGRVGLVFGIGAVASTLLHPYIGRLADQWGARRMTLYGLAAAAATLPLLGQSWSFQAAVPLFVLNAATSALIITPSLTYMGEATSQAGIGSFGVAYGIYNMAWGAGLLAGPAIGGYLYERLGFARLAIAWAPVLIIVTLWLARSGVRAQQAPLARAVEVDRRAPP